MRVKRYLVESMPDALQKIRNDLGKDAVILNTKEVRSGGFLGLFTKKKIEVIAASESTEAGATRKSSLASTNQNAAEHIKSSRDDVPISAAASQYKQMANMNDPSTRTSSAAVAVLEAPEKPSISVPHEIKKTTNQPLDGAREEEMMKEIRQMKEMMFKLSLMNQESSSVSPYFQKVEKRLLDQEVDPAIIQEILMRSNEQLHEQVINPITEQDAYLAVRNQLKKLLRLSGIKSIHLDTRIVNVVGPTGVGKTTTIAKLAAEQVLKYKRKVGFITADTYRIAAVEQLKTYATILNVPLEIVNSPQDLPKAFKQLEDRDIIFMDTAGRNYRNEMYVSELNSLLHTQGKSETYLVLSMTTKYADMKAITDNFNKFKIDKLLFSKLDETASYGAIINLIHQYSIPLSYMTNGQNVPNDIAEVREDQIIDLILGELSHG